MLSCKFGIDPIIVPPATANVRDWTNICRGESRERGAGLQGCLWGYYVLRRSQSMDSNRAKDKNEESMRSVVIIGKGKKDGVD